MKILQSIREKRYHLRCERSKNKSTNLLDGVFNRFEKNLRVFEKDKFQLTSEVLNSFPRLLHGLRISLQISAIRSYCNSMSGMVSGGNMTQQEYLQMKPLIDKWLPRTAEALSGDSTSTTFSQSSFEEFKEDLAQFGRDYPNFWDDGTSSLSQFEEKLWQAFFANYEDRLAQFSKRVSALRSFLEPDKPDVDKAAESGQLNDIEQMIDTNFSQIRSRDFENLIAELFKKMGYHVTVTSYTGDFGVDVIASKGEDILAIQVKKYRIGNNIGNRDVQSLLGAMLQRNVRANKSVLITSSDFTLQAIEQAKETPIELWNKNYLAEMLRKYM